VQSDAVLGVFLQKGGVHPLSFTGGLVFMWGGVRKRADRTRARLSSWGTRIEVQGGGTKEPHLSNAVSRRPARD